MNWEKTKFLMNALCMRCEERKRHKLYLLCGHNYEHPNGLLFKEGASSLQIFLCVHSSVKQVLLLLIAFINGNADLFQVIAMRMWTFIVIASLLFTGKMKIDENMTKSAF